jgi:23S rRNA pseudouridine1911/1915/1917 synthase
VTESTDLHFQITAQWRGKTLDAFLRQEAGLSRTRIRALKKNDAIRLDGRPAWVNRILTGGEQLQLQIATPCAQPQIIPEPLPLTLLYEDQDLAVVDKPAGMIVHPVKKHQSGTLANALVYHWQNRPGPAAFHPVHRLDRLTSGAIVIAKNPWIHQQLDRQIANYTLKRLYIAICQGCPQPASAKITAPIQSFPETPRRVISPTGKPAATRYRIVGQTPLAALLVVKLFTGRTHQIRVHLAYRGHALWGDPLYGQPENDFPRPALHAAQITFIHPRSGQLLRLRAPLPPDFRALADHLGLPEPLLPACRMRRT